MINFLGLSYLMTAAIYPYRLLRLVHEGIYGPIHQAEDTSTSQLIALQLFTKAKVRTESATPVLEAQTLTLSKLLLPKVRRPLVVGQFPDTGPYIAWEWSDAQPLKAPLTAPLHAITIAQQLAVEIGRASCRERV